MALGGAWMSNIFAPTHHANEQEKNIANARRIEIPDYTVSPSGFVNHVLAFTLGFIAGFCVIYIFYQIAICYIF